MSVLTDTLETFRQTAHTEREKGIYFENLAKLYFQNEPRYKDLYRDVWLWEAWRAEWIKAGNKDPGMDTGIDLVAETNGTNEYHAIQAKFYDSDSTIYKKQVDSFFTASGKKPFTHRLLILSTDKISPHGTQPCRVSTSPAKKSPCPTWKTARLTGPARSSKKPSSSRNAKSHDPTKRRPSPMWSKD